MPLIQDPRNPVDSGEQNQWMLDGRLITYHKQAQLYVAEKRFLDEGRPLTRLEVLGIVCAMLGKKIKDPPKFYQMLDTFDDSKDEFTSGLAKVSRENEEQLLEEVGGLFDTYLVSDQGAKSIRDNLKGLTKRLPDWRRNYWPSWCYRHLRSDETLLFYVMGKVCKDHKGEAITANTCKLVIAQMYWMGKSGGNTIFVTLRDTDKELTQEAAKIINMDKAFAEHFTNWAHGLHMGYTQKNRLPEPQLDMSSVVQSDLEPTTTSLGTLTLTATAPGPSQLTKPGPSQSTEQNQGDPSPFDDYFDYDSYNPQETEAPPPPSGSGSNEDVGKGKGRARESSSSSPGDKGSKKAKEKRPRRGGKSGDERDTQGLKMYESGCTDVGHGI